MQSLLEPDLIGITSALNVNSIAPLAEVKAMNMLRKIHIKDRLILVRFLSTYLAEIPLRYQSMVLVNLKKDASHAITLSLI